MDTTLKAFFKLMHPNKCLKPFLNHCCFWGPDPRHLCATGSLTKPLPQPDLASPELGAQVLHTDSNPVGYLLSELKEEGPSLSRRCSTGPWCCVSRCGSEVWGGCG